MVELLKAFGRGILYVICFPFFLVILALFAAVGLLAFIFQLFKSIFFFFTGQKFFPELPEDKELRLRREAEEAKNNPVPNKEPEINNILFEEPRNETPVAAPVEENKPTPKNVEEACFQDFFKEEPKTEVREEPVIEQAPVEETYEEPVMDTLMSEENNDTALDDFLSTVEEEAEQEEQLETYRPRGSEDSFQDEDNDSQMGVDINYED